MLNISEAMFVVMKHVIQLIHVPNILRRNVDLLLDRVLLFNQETFSHRTHQQNYFYIRLSRHTLSWHSHRAQAQQASIYEVCDAQVWGLKAVTPTGGFRCR